MQPQNLIIFMPDQWRGDYVGAAGNPYVKTPNLDRFSEEGTLFTNAFTTHPICGPSRCSFCTGWYPHTRGHRSQEYLIRHDEPHLFQYLKDAGYHIAWAGKNDMLESDLVAQTVDERLSIGKGSTVWGENPFSQDDARFYSFYHGKIEGTVDDHRDGRFVRVSEEFLRNGPPEPFCLFITPGFPHPPYGVPEPYFSMYDPADMSSPIRCENEGMPDFMEKLSYHSRLDSVDEEHVRKMRAVYCGMITMMDDLLGDLMQTLDDTGLSDRSTLFVTSDHGNFAGDYGMPEKWHTAMQDAITRIPMGVKMPGQQSTGISDALVQHIDIFGTILDMLQIQPQWGHFGESLLPVLSGQQNEVRDAVCADSGYNAPHEYPYAIARMKMPQMPDTSPYYPFYKLFTEHPHTASRTLMYRTHEWKYVWRQNDTDELYNLKQDPQEVHNLIRDESQEVQEQCRDMQRRLFEWYVRTGDVMPLQPAQER